MGCDYTNRLMVTLALSVVSLFAPIVLAHSTPSHAPHAPRLTSAPPTTAPTSTTTTAPANALAKSEPGVRDARQLTFPTRFIKAGESYFSPDAKRIVFQAIEVPTDGGEPADFYAMFVADLVRDGNDDIVALDNIRCVSPVGSANTCGLFHPTKPSTLLFGSTIGAPTAPNAPGFQRGTSRYKWSFPPETRIVEVDLSADSGKADRSPESLSTLEGDGTAYVAEGSVSPDGRFLLFTSLETGDGDLYVRDAKTGARTALVKAAGYDGGPFFSPEGKRICYRSDRKQDNLLQVFTADLVFGPDGGITGVTNERQLTSNEHVNWCPFFRPDGKTLLYASSEVGHRNYEVFEIVLPTDGSQEPIRRRVTESDGADVLPVFSPDGKWMLWTGQRHEGKSSQLYIGRYVPPAATTTSPTTVPPAATPGAASGAAR